MEIRAYRQDDGRSMGLARGQWVRQCLGPNPDLREVILSLANQSQCGDAFRIECDGRVVVTMNPGAVL